MQQPLALPPTATATTTTRRTARPRSTAASLQAASPQGWIGVVSREHVLRGVAGRFIQLGHGKKAPLQKLRAGDRIALYSPRTAYPDGAPLQCFTAIGVVRSGEVYQVEMAPDFHPYRVDVDFATCREAPIQPLIEHLSFIQGKAHWGAAFRFGYLKVPSDDFARIASAMEVEWPAAAG